MSSDIFWGGGWYWTDIWSILDRDSNTCNVTHRKPGLNHNTSTSQIEEFAVYTDWRTSYFCQAALSHLRGCLPPLLILKYILIADRCRVLQSSFALRRKPRTQLVLSTKTQSFATFCSTFDSFSFFARNQHWGWFLVRVPLKQGVSTCLVTSARSDASLCVSVRM